MVSLPDESNELKISAPSSFPGDLLLCLPAAEDPGLQLFAGRVHETVAVFAETGCLAIADAVESPAAFEIGGQVLQVVKQRHFGCVEHPRIQPHFVDAANEPATDPGDLGRRRPARIIDGRGLDQAAVDKHLRLADANPA